jgi:glycosyltransferase involved in cell wall biosynthesis
LVNDTELNFSSPVRVDISIIILCYNRENFILDAVCSVKNSQSDQFKAEIVVVKSFHNASIEKKLSELNVEVVHDDSAIIGMRFDEALKIAQGEIIFLLDDDDIFFPGKIQTHMKLYNKYNNIDYIANGYNTIGPDGNKVKANIRKRTRILRSLQGDELLIERGSNLCDIICAVKALDMGFNSSRISFRRSSIMPYLEYLRNVEINLDTGLFFIAFYFFRGILDVKDVLTGYRIHSQNISARDQKNDLNFGKLDGIIRYAKITESFYRYSRLALQEKISDLKFKYYCLSTENTAALFLSLVKQEKLKAIAENLARQIIYSIKCRAIRFFYRTTLLSIFITLVGLTSPRLLRKITVKLGVIPNLA